MQKSKKKSYSFKLFLMILPFLILVILFSYYPLYGWMYAFYDYKPPRTLANSQFVGFKWFVSLVNNPVKVKQIAQVMKNTFAMSGLTIGTNWLPMLFAVFLNEIRGVKFRKFVQTVTTLPNFVSWILVYSIAFSLFNSTGIFADSYLESLIQRNDTVRVNGFHRIIGQFHTPCLIGEIAESVFVRVFLVADDHPYRKAYDRGEKEDKDYIRTVSFAVALAAHSRDAALRLSRVVDGAGAENTAVRLPDAFFDFERFLRHCDAG